MSQISYALNDTHTFNVSSDVAFVGRCTAVFDVCAGGEGKFRRDNSFVLNRYEISVC